MKQLRPDATKTQHNQRNKWWKYCTQIFILTFESWFFGGVIGKCCPGLHAPHFCLLPSKTLVLLPHLLWAPFRPGAFNSMWEVQLLRIFHEAEWMNGTKTGVTEVHLKGHNLAQWWVSGKTGDRRQRWHWKRNRSLINQDGEGAFQFERIAWTAA